MVAHLRRDPAVILASVHRGTRCVRELQIPEAAPQLNPTTPAPCTWVAQSVIIQSLARNRARASSTADPLKAEHHTADIWCCIWHLDVRGMKKKPHGRSTPLSWSLVCRTATRTTGREPIFPPPTLRRPAIGAVFRGICALQGAFANPRAFPRKGTKARPQAAPACVASLDFTIVVASKALAN